MRKILLVLAVAVAVAIGFSMSTLRAKVTRSVAELVASAAERPDSNASAGDVRLAFLPRPVVEVHDVSVREPWPDGTSRLRFEAPLIRVYPRLLPLLVGRAEIQAAEAIGATMVVRRERTKSVYKWMIPLVGEAGFPALGFQLIVTNGDLRLEDRSQSPFGEVDIGGLELEIDPVDEQGAIPFHARAAAVGDASRTEMEGTVRPNAGPTGGAQVDLRFSVEDGDPAVLQTLAPRLAGAPMVGEVDLRGSALGLYGEVSTESIPATPLDVQLQGSVGLTYFGRTEVARFELSSTLDDKRFTVKSGTLRWGDLPLAVTGYFFTDRGGKLAMRLSGEHVDIEKLLESFGVAERWCPKGELAGTIRVTGSLEEPLIRYEVMSPAVSYDKWSPAAVKAVDVTARGSLLAINADISASYEVADLSIGPADLSDVRFGTLWWRERFTLNRRELPLWGGVIDIGLGWYADKKSFEGGGIADNLDGSVVAANLIPGVGVEISGRLDSLFQLGIDSSGPWAMGRIGLHRGRFGPRGFGRALVDSIAQALDRADAIDDSLVRKYRDFLRPDYMSYRRCAFDFESREEGFSFKSVKIEMPEGRIDAEGLVDLTATTAAWGTMVLAPDLTADLVSRIEALRPLVAADGSLHVPFRMQGPRDNLIIAADDRFLQALHAAARGEPVEPFAPMEPTGTITMDLPSLDEQFYR